jgi:GNAT superfamily N-acetyltransferase
VLVGVEPFDGPDSRWLIAQALAELDERYGGPADEHSVLTAAQFDPPAGAFVVARHPDERNPVGGVGLRPVGAGTSTGTGVGEVKRLWVHPDWRGRGVARLLMGELESVALALGRTALRIETGARQPEAIALYTSTGWVRQHTTWEGGPLAPGSFFFAKDLGAD